MGKGRTSLYPQSPVTIVFKTSNRSNAQTKIKTFKNRNIDEILNENSVLPGIPECAEWLEVGVGESFINSYKIKYNL
jgi:hypothetical protein